LASNHLSDLDVPAILAAIPSRRRTRVTPAMAKEFFEPHFFPERHGWRRRLTNSLNYYLAALLLGGFPLPRREAGAQQALRYMGEAVSDGFSVLIFPEGSRSEDGVIRPFRAGVGMIASRLELPVVPVRLEGLEHVLRRGWKWPRRGGVRVAFGPSLRLIGNDYSGLATRVEQAVRAL
jgi:long-chain acyl-CoA synthetase